MILSIKLIVTDMDGTLLNEHIEITDRARKAFLNAQDVGLEVAIATGRTVESGYSLVKEQGISCPFIELNGARLFDENEKLHFTRAMEKDDVKQLVEILDYYGVQNEFITQNGAYTNRTMEEYVSSFKDHFQSINRTLSDGEMREIIIKRMDSFDIHLVDDYDFLYSDGQTQVLKAFVNAQGNLPILNEIGQTIENNFPDIIVTSSGKYNLEINHAHAHKGQAVSEFAHMRGYSPDEVITIGDNLNDVTMLEWATHSYAVSNANDQAKKAARYLAPSHQEDAVAQIIEKVINKDSLKF